MVVQDVYAQSLFELAKEQNKLDLIFSQLKFARDNVFSNDDFVKVMASPEIDFNTKVRVLRKVFSDADSILVNFLCVLLKKNRFDSVGSISKSFFDMCFDFKNILRVKVASAIKLSEEFLSRLRENLSNRYSSDIMLENVVDTDIIGGYIIQIGETVVDMSIRGKLDSLKVCLTDS